MKKILLISLAILACTCLDAQKKPSNFLAFGAKSRQALEKENSDCHRKIDSLQKVIDSLEYAKAMEDSIISEVVEPIMIAREYTPEQTDSLMALWMESTKSRMYEPIGMGDDSTVFTSNVSDEEMQRRLENLNSFITLPFNSIVRRYMIVYAEKNPQMMSEVLGLSNYYMPIFEEALARYNLPLELKYMAVIESRLNPTAESRVGARGMWQFMYQTGKSYGLKINSFVDERFDVVKSADAAARFLRDAYEIFGDWNLAICSYNCGIGNVNKAIRRSGSRKFWDLYDFLPRETRGYVPAFVGAMYAMNYYKEYGIVPADMGMPAGTDTIMISNNLHFKQINEVVGVPIEQLKKLNPQYVHEIIPGKEAPSALTLPFNWIGPFIDCDNDSLYAHKSENYLNEKVLKDIQDQTRNERIRYKVKSGDYLGRIATRYHVSVKQIMKWNHMKNTNIRAGQILYIYRR